MLGANNSTDLFVRQIFFKLICLAINFSHYVFTPCANFQHRRRPSSLHLIISPPGNDSFRESLCFARIYYFFSSRNLRAPSADRREILHDARSCVQFYNPGPKFWGSLLKKILGAKNMQNLARFRSTSKFGGEYLR